jgi:hypothetical protein
VTHYVDSRALLQKHVQHPVESDDEHQYTNHRDKSDNQLHLDSLHQSSTYTDHSSDGEQFRLSASDDEGLLGLSDVDSFSGDRETFPRKETTKGKGSKNFPWPDEHDKFLQSTEAREHLCLEIASGYAADYEPTWIDVNKNMKGPRGVVSSKKQRRHPLKGCRGPVLLPGSLRERGEFCILELALIDQKQKTKAVVQSSAASKHERRFAWEVQAVKFHRMA